MSCAAGSLCAAIPDHTPGPPLFTIHKCRVCGSYLHGLCGLPDPLGDNEMQRVCHGCVNLNNRKESSADHAAGATSSKRLRPERQETGKEKQAGALDSLKRVGNTAARKARGADTSKRPTFEQQVEALDLLKSMSGTATIAARLSVDSDDDEVDSLAGDKGQCTQPVLSPRPPPYTDVARQFGGLEGIAERCSMAGVSYHLRKEKLAWMSEAGSKKTKQTCMADFM